MGDPHLSSFSFSFRKARRRAEFELCFFSFIFHMLLFCSSCSVNKQNNKKKKKKKNNKKQKKTKQNNKTKKKK